MNCPPDRKAWRETAEGSMPLLVPLVALEHMRKRFPEIWMEELPAGIPLLGRALTLADSEAMKAGIAVDDWKLPVFRKRLTAAGYKYEDGGALTSGVTLLTVKTNNMFALKKVLEECQAECAEMKKGTANEDGS
jgi:hypothetical protein